MSYEEYAIERLNDAWSKYLDMLRSCIERLNHNLALNKKYFETAAKKGKTQAQIAQRIRKNEEDVRSLQKYELDLDCYSQQNDAIQAGEIKPHCLKTCDSSGNVLRIDAYYALEMPDGYQGFFDPSYPYIVRRLRN